jgi:hypothetical protein
MDWAKWSHESVALMTTRMSQLLERHELPAGAPYHWDMETGTMVIGGISFPLVTVGTAAGNSFLWSWANDTLPASGKRGIERVRAYGIEHDLPLLSEPEHAGGVAQAKECVALAGRILDAAGFWFEPTEYGCIVFVLFEPTPAR